jgi:hypothetical protein
MVEVWRGGAFGVLHDRLLRRPAGWAKDQAWTMLKEACHRKKGTSAHGNTQAERGRHNSSAP